MPQHLSERRTEELALDLLQIRGWNTAKPPRGSVVTQNEYRALPSIRDLFAGASKSGPGDGYPEFVCVDTRTEKPLLVIECKADESQFAQAMAEATGYGDACRRAGHDVIAVGIAGQERTYHRVGVRRWANGQWSDIVYEGRDIGWIPGPQETTDLLTQQGRLELAPSVPSPGVLASQAENINRTLRECGVRDELRPAYVGAFMLAMWSSKGRLRKDPDFVLGDINGACETAFSNANKQELARSLHVDEANSKLASRAWTVIAILEKLNVVSADFSHDYLGQLYEAFFRYTGGNTIGQYFTPRHITKFMADVCEVGVNDIVIDPACGTGGFLIGALQRAKEVSKMSYADTVKMIRDNLRGYEIEPATAALCVANMILRGDGKSGIERADSLQAEDYPVGQCDVALLNPPFPHKKTDAHPTAFVDRALEALHDRGRLAAILPTSVLVKSGRTSAGWRERILQENTLLGVVELPGELFQPYASATTSIVLLEAGIPHDSMRDSVFVRIKHDGLTLKKSVRVADIAHPSQLDAARDAIINRRVVPGLSGLGRVSGDDEWTAGAYVMSAPPTEEEITTEADDLMRQLMSTYSRYAMEIARQRKAIDQGLVHQIDYLSTLSDVRIRNAEKLPRRAGTVGEQRLIVYGQKELHSRDGIPPGDTLVVSPTESYNGTYGWLAFPQVLRPPFVTVAQTGSIGEAFLQIEPCAVNDDCLVLLPRDGETNLAQLLITAATIRLEKWRFSYGRKLTPARIADFVVPEYPGLVAYVEKRLGEWLSMAEDVVNLYEGVQPTEDPLAQS
jgi:type I restriction enzyme M protein